MLPDLERKLHRILINYSMHRQGLTPNIKLLEHMIGRTKEDIMQALQSLEGKGYIHWRIKPDTATIAVIKAEEDSSPSLAIKHDSGSDYWTFY